ncbi:MAG TPA: hypothetical protein VFV38_36940 [Ktedonobacteraceae bacterium]|nr:hypothetical protein [Ktedonobacteraceae bacterium]
MLTQMGFSPTERATAGCLALPKNGGDLGKLVLENFAQEEDGALEGLLTVVKNL